MFFFFGGFSAVASGACSPVPRCPGSDPPAPTVPSIRSSFNVSLSRYLQLARRNRSTPAQEIALLSDQAGAVIIRNFMTPNKSHGSTTNWTLPWPRLRPAPSTSTS